jgi:hypothetical protein
MTTLVHNCSFDNCTAQTGDTGGLLLWNFNVSGSTNHSTYMTVFGCRFIHCTSTNAHIGGLVIHTPPSGVGIQDCLFHKCRGSTGCGGIWFHVGSDFPKTGEFVCYCLFVDNTCGSTYPGKDIHVYLPSQHFTSNITIECYTTGTQTCYQNGTGYVNWLGSTGGQFTQTVNEYDPHALDTYGCGIHVDWPCASVGWANDHILIAESTTVVDIGIYRENEIYVENIPTDHGIKCGQNEKPCQTLNIGSTHFSEYILTKEIILLSNIVSNTKYENDKSLTIKTKDDIEDGYELSLAGGTSSCFDNANSLTFSKLKLKFSSSVSGA